MHVVHPFLTRIRTERTIISLINKSSSYLGSELTGLSKEAVEAWFNGIYEPIKLTESMTKVRDKLEYMSRLTKLASNGSHRGAMIAPVPNKEVTQQLLHEISQTMEEATSINKTR